MAGFPGLAGGRTGAGPLLTLSTTVLLLCGCSSGAVQQCERLTQIPGKDGLGIDDGSLSPAQYEAIHQACSQSFEKTGRSTFGLAVAKADYYLRRDEQALRWADRLQGTADAAGAWGIAAGVYQRRGDLKLERTARERIVGLRLAANDHRSAARAYYLLFTVAYREANLRDQIEFLRLAYEEASKAGFRELQKTVITAISTPLVEIGDLNSVRRVLKAATELAVSDKKPHPELPHLEGIIRLREGQTSLAVASFRQSLDLAGANAAPEVLRPLYLNLVEASLAAGRLEDAEAYLQSAWKHTDASKSLPSSLFYYRALVARTRGQYRAAREAALTALAARPGPGWEWQLEYELGRAHEGLGEVVAAEAAFKRSVEHVETLRRSVDFDDFKFWLLDRRRQPYEALFRLHARAGQSQRALEILERAKARTFLDAFIRAASTTRESGDMGLLSESTQRLDGLQSLLPAMSKSTAVDVRPIDAVLAGVADKNVLMYFETGSELWLMTLVGGRIRLHELSRSTETMRRLVDRFVASHDDPAIAATLGEALLPPDALPRTGATVYIVTDGSLGRLPFAALRPRGRILVRDYTISYVPSLNALYAADERAPVAYGPAVVLGDPRVNLPAAALESADVGQRLGVTPVVGKAATRAALDRAAHARVLHLATHTGLGAQGPWLAVADGDIGAASLISQGTQPQLAVLATCASAAKEGREMWGSLGAAFLAAGSKAVLASLWSVDDHQAREFIIRFYDEWRAGDSATALARTQRAFIESGKPASFWAPYVHFGSSRVVQNP
jgi:tetratricopeptide (TPR) repeat protein